jgi:hypothetical protein
MKLLCDADKLSVDERRLYRLAGVGKGRNLEKNLVSESHTDSRNHQIPIDAFDGDVFSDGSDVNRVSLYLKGMDPLEGVNANSAFRSAVVLYVILAISFKPK